MRSLAKFFHPSFHRPIFFIAAPMILSNLTTPLMGLVDTAVLGRLDSVSYLAGASVTALFVTQLYWLCGFLRMTTTGLSAQAKGKQSLVLACRCLSQGLLLSGFLALLILLCQDLLLRFILLLANAEVAVAQVISDYFVIRIWGAPAALANLVLIGWLIGQQQAKSVLWIQICGNLLNALLSIELVVYWHLDVQGVALATVVAEYCMCVLGMLAIKHKVGRLVFDLGWFSVSTLQQFMTVNGHTFVRNLTLQLCLAFLVFQGMRFGLDSAAVNAILLQFFSLIALGLDGIAFSAEALVGEQAGRKQHHGIAAVTLQSLLWSWVLACIYSVIFAGFTPFIVAGLTTNPSIQGLSLHYVTTIVCLPLLAHWCFLFDGVFVGLGRAKAMQNSMLFSALVVYFPLWLVLRPLENQGLWMALLAFLLARGLSLGGYFIYLYRRRFFLHDAVLSPQ